MKTKSKPADIWFSKCVRERADWTCERCGKVLEEGSMGLHCSHVFSRRYRTIRWCADNAQALCFQCHQWYGGNPIDSGRWVEEVLGEGKISLLREKINNPVKVTKAEEKQIAKHYRQQLDKIKGERMDGVRARVEFESWQ